MITKHLPIVSVFLLGLLIVKFSAALSHQSVGATSDPDPEITFLLPETSVTYKVRDLPVKGSRIIIPSQDQSPVQFSYDALTGMVNLSSTPYDYSIERSDLNDYLTPPIPPTQSVSPPYQVYPRYAPTIETYNARLNNVYRQDLVIKLKDGSKETDFSLPPSLIRSIIIPTSLNLFTPLAIDEPVLLGYILPRLTPKQKEYFSPTATVVNVKKGLSDRLSFQRTPLVLGVDDGPTSSGEFASKYLEIDLSQQKMYLFINGQLVKDYHVSTGLDYPTPIGDYHILNKAPLAFSSIYNVWMPYWMAFTYAGDVRAYLGIHEKAYSHLAKGEKIYNHALQIGDKLTGGCVATDPSVSQEVYDLSDIGMLVRIVP